MKKNDKERESDIVKFRQELEEKEKKGIILTEFEKNVSESTDELLDPSLWAFLKKYEENIFSKISDDEFAPTEEDVSIAREFQTAKVARESVEQVNPTPEINEKPGYRDIEYAKKYYNELINRSSTLLTVLEEAQTRKIEREGEARDLLKDVRSKIEDLLMVYKYKKIPAFESQNLAQETYHSIHKKITEVDLVNVPKREEIINILSDLSSYVRELRTYSEAKADEVSSYGPEEVGTVQKLR